MSMEAPDKTSNGIVFKSLGATIAKTFNLELAKVFENIILAYANIYIFCSFQVEGIFLSFSDKASFQ